MGMARIEYALLFVAAVAYFSQLQRSPSLLELLVFFGIGAFIYEAFGYSIKKKIEKWPSDSANSQSVIDKLGTIATIQEIKDLEFGSAGKALISKLEEVANPGIQAARFHDTDLRNAYGYLREQLNSLLTLIGEEMYAVDNRPDYISLPIDWKNSANVELALRYRQTQAKLLQRSNSVVEAIEAFANSFQGGYYRI